MPRFFVQASLENVEKGQKVRIDGKDARHIQKSLRMNIGESLMICDGIGYDAETVVDAFDGDTVVLRVIRAFANQTEPTVKVTLYQGLPKGDKLETIIQKCVELGVTEIVPVVMSRSIAKPGDKIQNKLERWQKISDEAAGQSGRGILPKVREPISFDRALKDWENEKVLVCYEKGGQPLGESVCPQNGRISFVVGPEGGISEEEIERMKQIGAVIVSMGPRILRTETAPIAALAVLMEKSGNLG